MLVNTLTRKIASSACATLLLTSLVSCASKTEKAPNKVIEVRVAYAFGELFTKVHEQIAEEFEKENPNIDIKLEAPLPEYEELAQRTLVGIPQKNAPTLSFQGINQIRQFVDTGHAYDLTEFVKNDPRWKKEDGFYPKMIQLGEFDGKQYAIPFAVSTPIMYYNADLFRKAGLDPDSPPKTWSEVIKAAKKIDALGNNITGLWYDYQITGNWCYQALVYSEGGSMMNEDETKITFNEQAGIRAAKLIRQFVDEGVMKDWNRQQGQQSFFSGNVGFYFTSTSELKKAEDKARFDLRTALFPLSSIGKRQLPTGGNGAIIISDDPDKARAAYEYAMFASGPIGTKIMVTNTGYMPVHSKALDESFYRENPNFKTSVEQIPYIFRWYSFPGRNNLKIIDDIKNALQSVVSRQQEPETAINEAAEQASQLVQQ